MSSIFLAQKLISFTEAVFWLAHGLERRHALNFGTHQAGNAGWSAETFEQIVAEWREIIVRAGVEPSSVATSALASLPVEDLLIQSQRSEIFLNFLIYLAKSGGASVPGSRIADPQLSQLYDLLRMQDVTVAETFAERLGQEEGIFLQVGANDGDAPDDQAFHRIYRNDRWRKILLEPNPDAAARLREFVSGMPSVTVIQAAVSDRFETREMTMHDISRLSTLVPGTQGPVPGSGSGRQVPVQCLDGPSLFQAAEMERVDILVCDTEGHDRVVLEQVLRCTRPSSLCIEYANLPLGDRVSVLNTLKAHGYDWCRAPLSLDVLAVRRSD